MTQETDCPGAGRCHNAAWCPDCDVGPWGPCDVRAAGGQCSAHRPSHHYRPLLEQARLDEAREARTSPGSGAHQRCAAEARELQEQLTAALADEVSR